MMLMVKMKDMIKTHNCLYCEEEINSESETVFCSDECLKQYVLDARDLEELLNKNISEDYTDAGL